MGSTQWRLMVDQQLSSKSRMKSDYLSHAVCHLCAGPLEQNPNTNSRWAQLAREGKKVMQFLSGGKYVANVVDGKAQVYGRTRR